MKRLAIAATALTLALAGCGGAATTPMASGPAVSDDLLEDFGLDGMDAVEAIEHLDQLAVSDRPTELMAAVYPEELVLTDNTRETVLALPEDSSYLSIAPYVDETHDCFYHSLTTCLGELSNEPVSVRIVDNTTGEEVLTEETTTYDNGFIGAWVPREITDGTVEVTYDGSTASTEFTTTREGATCITDLQISA